MPRLTKAQKMEKAEKYLGLEPDPNLTTVQRVGRVAQAFNARRKEFDEMEHMIGTIIGGFLNERPRNA